MRVQQFYLHRSLLTCILDEAGRAQKQNDLQQVLQREREFLQENRQRQADFNSRFEQLCSYEKRFPRWFQFSSHPNILLDTHTGMVWPLLQHEQWTMFDSLDELDGWRLPFKEEVIMLLKDGGSPLLSHESKGIAQQDRIPISSTRALCIDDRFPELTQRDGASPLCTSSIYLAEQEWPVQSWEELIRFFSVSGLIPEEESFARALLLVFEEGKQLKKEQRASEDRLLIGKEQLEKLELQLKEIVSRPKNVDRYRFQDAELSSFKQFLIEKDWRCARLPKLEEAVLFDQSGGLWELGLTEPPTDEYIPVEIEESWEAQNIVDTIRHESMVAIDFGTSNTVVAVSENEHVELLRLGLEDWFDDVEAHHYENPTLLEFLDADILEVWKKVPHRPPMRWNDVSVAHPVRTKLQEQGADMDLSRRILSRIKLWIRNEQGGRIYDQGGKEVIMGSPQLRPFDPCEPMSLGEEYPIDPIEMYAFYLGMSINTRQRGLHLQYYLSFPVQYTFEQREIILSSFRRGLYRSLPAAIAQSDYAKDFDVSSIGTEPAAFAASLIEEMDDPPTKEGKAFAVFDFGGGTTDFAFGFWRKAQPDVLEEWGNYAVIEHFSPSGDVHLGGEIILWKVAYLIYEQNISLMRSKKIPFLQPPGEKSIEGMEVLLHQGHIAQNNVLLMMEKFRPIWERRGEALSSNEGISITLRDYSGELQTLELFIRVQEIEEWMVARIYYGIQNFILALYNAFRNRSLGEQIEVFLAGNASRSPIVQLIFGLEVEEDEHGFPHRYLDGEKIRTCHELLQHIWKEKCPKLHIHPVRVDEGSSLNCKTGVALGMISLTPGKGLLEKSDSGMEEQPPFSLFVGFKWGPVFHCVLKQNQKYHVWKNMGGVSMSGVFLLYYSFSPLSVMGDTSRLKMKKLRFEVDNEKLFAFVRAVGPYSIEVCVSDTMNISKDGGMQHQTFTCNP